MRQARGPLPMSLARDAAMRDVARSFAMPLRAAGIDASVAVRFVDPCGAGGGELPRSAAADRGQDKGEEPMNASHPTGKRTATGTPSERGRLFRDVGKGES